MRLPCCLLIAPLLVPGLARADAMDPALSRLRIVGGREGCDAVSQPGLYCPDNELFERLVSELAVTMAPPVNLTARSVGPRGFHLGFDTTITTIEAEQHYWLRGTEGDAASAAEELNDSPSGVLVWNRLEARKGLPLGLEVGSSVARGMSTSLWSLGLSLRWSVVEGFHSGAGKLPDVSVRGAMNRVFGTDQLSIDVYGIDLVLSKPFVLEGAWSVSPVLGGQLLVVDASSGVVDLTPGGASFDGTPPPQDAFASCAPIPGHDIGGEPTSVACTAPSPDLANDVTFEPLQQVRARVLVGSQVRYQQLILGTAIHFDVSAPQVDAKPLRHLRSQSVARQVAFNVSLGVVL